MPNRVDLDALADYYAERFNLDPEKVAVDYTRGTIEVPADHLWALLERSEQS